MENNENKTNKKQNNEWMQISEDQIEKQKLKKKNLVASVTLVQKTIPTTARFDHGIASDKAYSGVTRREIFSYGI